MIFCKGTKRNLKHLMNLFKLYGDIFGQMISHSKCKYFSGTLSPNRNRSIGSILGFSAGRLPFNYLGVPIFKRKPKKIHLQSIADRIKVKLSTWRGSLLSIMGRVQLVKSIIQGMLLYIFHIYLWPTSQLKLLDSWIRNFIWSGDILKRKLITVSR